MRPILFLILIPLLFSCKDKDNDPPPVQNNPPALSSGQVALHHDDYNMDAPELEVGQYRVAAKFTASEMEQMQGGRLVAVQYHMAEKPTSATVRIFKGDDINAETQVYSKNVLPEMNRLNWNVHQLNDTVYVDDQPMWIALYFTASSAQKYIGCDPGPAHANGDWMFASSDNEWIRFVDRTETSINWNIRGVVEP